MSRPPAPLGPHHVAVVAADLALAERFYAALLGLPVVRRWDDERGAPRSFWVGLGGGAFLAVERAGVDAPRRDDLAPGLHCLALAIPRADREAWRAWLAAGGHPVLRESAFSLYVRDPDGAWLALSHYPDASG